MSLRNGGAIFSGHIFGIAPSARVLALMGIVDKTGDELGDDRPGLREDPDQTIQAKGSEPNPTTLRSQVRFGSEPLSQQRKAGISLARRRYQRGTLIQRGTREKVWVGRWLEDSILPDGTIKRVHKSEVLGSVKDFPTKRLAQRELDGRVSVVNSPTYRARPTATFRQLAEKWQTLVMVHHEDSTQRSEKSDIKAWVSAIGDVQIRDIDCELLQEVVNGWTCNPKTIKNRVGTFRLIWDKAKLWRYTAETAYDGLELPDWEKAEQPCFSVGEISRIIDHSPQPYKTVWRLVAETAIRRGEICGLNVGDVDVNQRIIVVQRSRTKRGKLKAPKAGVRNGQVKRRVFSLSPSLTEQLRPFVEGRAPDEPLFLTPGRVSKSGKQIGGRVRLEPDNFVKRALKPVLKELGLEGAAHAFRHGNATLLDTLHAPMAVRQERLGHVDAKTTLGYTHLVTADDVRVANELGAILDKKFFAQDLPKLNPNAKTASELISEAV
jgi:integrase